MIKIGQVALKIAGRDSGCLCVIVDVADGNFVVVDGETRRKKCNLKHLAFLDSEVKIKKNASTDEVKKALVSAGYNIKDVKKGKKRTKKEKPKKIRKTNKKEEPVKTKGKK